MATKIKVERERGEPQTPPDEPAEPATPDEPQKRSRGRPRIHPERGTPAAQTPAQRAASVANLERAGNGRAKKADLESAVLEREKQIAELKQEVERQKNKKKREKERANTLQQHYMQQSDPKKKLPTEDVAEKHVTTHPIPVETQPPNPRQDPRIRRLMENGASFEMAKFMLS